MNIEMMNMVGNPARPDQIENLNRELREQQQAQAPPALDGGEQIFHPGADILMAREVDFPWYMHM